MSVGYEYRLNGGSPVDNGTSTSIDFTGTLNPGTSYTFEARSYDDVGNRSAWSTPIVVSTLSSIRIDAGSSVDHGNWKAETGLFTGGTAYSIGQTGAELSRPLLPGRPAETHAAGTHRYGAHSWTKTGLKPSTNCLIRIHANDEGAFGWEQSIKVNGVTVISDYVVATDAGGANRVSIKEAVAAADGSGQVLIELVGGGGHDPACCEFEIHQPVPSPYTVFHWAGDSITEGGGTGVNLTTRYVQLLLNADNRPHNLTDGANTFPGAAYDDTLRLVHHVAATSGNKISDQTSRITVSNLWDYYADPLYDGVHGVFFMCGTNDLLAGGTTTAGLESDITAFFAAAASKGAVWKGMCTILPNGSTSPTDESHRVAVNSWIMANSLGLDLVVDIASDSRLSNPNNTTYYSGDAVHPNAAGHIVIAELLAGVLPAWEAFTPPPPPAPIALLGHTAAMSTNGGSSATTSAVDTTGASLIVLASQGHGTVSDSAGNTWTALTNSGGGGDSVQLHYCMNPTTSASHTFTAGGTNTPVLVEWFSGTKLTSVFDVENGAGVTSATIQPGSVTPAGNNSLLVTATIQLSGSTVSSVDSGFTSTDTTTLNGSSYPMGMAYKIQTTLGAENPTWTYSGSGASGAAIAVFKQA